MSSSSKIIGIAVIVAVLIAIGAWWHSNNSSSMQASSTTQSGISDTGSQPASQVAQAPANGSAGTGASAGTASDASMQSDASKIDTQMSGLGSDSASADQSLSSQ